MSGYGPGETPGGGWRAWFALAVVAVLTLAVLLAVMS